MSLTIRPLDGGERLLGVGHVDVTFQDNPDLATLRLGVHPEHRGEGIATALLEQAIIPGLHAEGREKVIAFGEIPADADPTDPSLPWNRIAARLGLETKNVSICRLCPLPVPEPALAACEADARERSGDYRIELWVDEVPEEHLEAYGVLLRQLDLDEPDGDVEYEAPEFTPERIRDMERRRRESEQRILIAVAIAPDGSIAGNSEVTWSTTPGAVRGWQMNTLVMPEHRGHRLGLALKAATHRRIVELVPELRTLVTWNSETNPWMIAINERLGYEIAFRSPVYQGPTPR